MAITTKTDGLLLKLLQSKAFQFCFLLSLRELDSFLKEELDNRFGLKLNTPFIPGFTRVI